VTRARPTLPLGIDIGSTRVRIALAIGNRTSTPRLIGVSTREHAGRVTEALREAIRELHTDERRCILALGPPDALLRPLPLPPMPRWERPRAGRFEATRFVEYPIEEAELSLVPTGDAPGWVLGIARRAALSGAFRAARSAGLRPVAVDDIGFALRRAYPEADCAIDLGADATRIVFFTHPIPTIACIPIGGHQLSTAIARSLGIHLDAAEQRKRHIGFGGAGEAERDSLIAAIAAATMDARQSGRCSAERVVLCGNGGRIPGFADALTSAIGTTVSLAALPAASSDTVPADVLRTAGADWSIAYGLSLWSHAS
jgi:Tfp pilus assembly PilM family ATPase